jgi:hypothetical protein
VLMRRNLLYNKRRLPMRTITLVVLLALTAMTRAAEFDVAALRDEGPTGLQRAIDNGAPPEIIDAVAGQRHASVSHLYWYTDLDRAVAAATAQGKPIVSLRLLGNLTDELSCANSRYFRTTLYANQRVSAMLRDGYILHWQSVRPVPRVTIDFGNGRTLTRTITGNSIHWILDSQGRPVDALPGVYAANAFMRLLETAGEQARSVSALDDAKRASQLAAWHDQRLAAMDAAWQEDLAATNLIDGSPLTDEQWLRIAALRRDDVDFDPQVMRLIERQANPNAAEVMPLAMSKSAVERPMLRVAMINRFAGNITLDTVKNEYNFHRSIHGWFVQDDAAAQNVAKLNERAYDELFQTPSNDPWLGLAPPDAFAALDGGGLRIMDR